MLFRITNAKIILKQQIFLLPGLKHSVCQGSERFGRKPFVFQFIELLAESFNLLDAIDTMSILKRPILCTASITVVIGVFPSTAND